MVKRLLILLFLGIATFSLSGQMSQLDQLQENHRLTVRKTNETIKIDGVLDEEVWNTAQVATDFWLSFPVDDEMAAPETQTEARVTYDDKNIYIAAKCKGGAPYLMPSLKRDSRDFWSGENFGVIIDPLNERSNAFIFGTNTSGVQNESLISGGMARRSGVNSANLNSAWDQAWLSESKVYGDYWTVEMAIPFKSLRFSDNQTWGINFWRGMSATNEWHSWTKTSIDFMVVDVGHTGGMDWDTPPANTKSNISVIPYTLASTSKDFQDGNTTDNQARVGVDAKVALTSSLNLDLTINPDFSQVDVDEQVTNLSTVNLRFPERRLFFLENNDLYSDFGIPPLRPFFSRKIGLDDDGNTIPIAYGARLSGNVNKDFRIGVMNLQTRSTEEFAAQNYTSITGHQQVLGRSVIKGYLHNRQATGNNEVADDTYNRVGGLEFLYISNDSKWRSAAGYGKSWSTGLSGDDYFYSWLISYNTRKFSFYTNISGVGDNYRTDVGFNPRFNHYDAVRDTTVKIGYNHGFTTMRYNIFPKDSKVQSHSFSIFNVLDYTAQGNDLIANRTFLRYSLLMNSTAELNMTINHEEQGLFFPFAFTDDDPLPIGVYKFNFFNFEYSSDSRKDLGYTLGYRNGGFYNGDRQEYSLGLKYRAQPWGNFSMNFVYNQLEFPENYGSRELLLIGPKMEVNFTRNLFWTTFLQYNTQADNFNVNSRLQWRFKPLSDIFIVYTDNYATDIWAAKNRGLVIKMNYWLNL